MRLTTLTMLGFEINAVWDSLPDCELNFKEVHFAAEHRSLIPLLKQRFGDRLDLSLLTSDPSELREVEESLAASSDALEGRVRRKTGVHSSGICLVMALILQSLQTHFGDRQVRVPTS